MEITAIIQRHVVISPPLYSEIISLCAMQRVTYMNVFMSLQPCLLVSNIMTDPVTVPHCVIHAATGWVIAKTQIKTNPIT